MKLLSSLIALLFPCHICLAAATNNTHDSLSLEQAFAIAERRQPDLAEARALVDAAAGRVQQAGAFPNPEAVVGAQQLPFERGTSNPREYTAGIAQPIPLGGRLGKAREVEQLEREVRLRGLEITRLNLRRRVHSAFATALYQERAFQTRSHIAQVAEKAVTTTKARLDAGDAVPEDLARVEIELARAKVETLRSQSLREEAMTTLAAAVGDPSIKAKTLSGNLDTTFEIPTLKSLAANLSMHPEFQLADASLRARSARLDLAEAERIPDVKVEVLYHRLEATKENTFDIGLSIPLPLFNRNQGRMREAHAELQAAEARSRSVRNELSLRLQESCSQLTRALAGSRTLQFEILPRAETLLKSAEARYAAGDSSISDVVPVRLDWAALQLSYLESLRDVMQAWLQVSTYLKTQTTNGKVAF